MIYIRAILANLIPWIFIFVKKTANFLCYGISSLLSRIHLRTCYGFQDPSLSWTVINWRQITGKKTECKNEFAAKLQNESTKIKYFLRTSNFLSATTQIQSTVRSISCPHWHVSPSLDIIWVFIYSEIYERMAKGRTHHL